MKRTPLRRSGYLKRGTKPLARRKRLHKVNPERAARERLRAFGPQAEWMRDCACSACWRPSTGPSDPSHVKSRGARGDRDDLVPMCRACHERFHLIGIESFEAERGVDLAMLARMYAAAWLALPEETRARYVQLFKERWPEAGKLLSQG